MNLKELIGSIPSVRAPGRILSTEEKIKWTAAAGLIFLVMGFVPLPVSPDSFPISYRQELSSLFTILGIGVGPIITGILLMQILLRFGLLKLDFNDILDRRFFYGLQKIFILLLAILEAYVFIEGFRLADTTAGFFGLVFLMVIGTISLLFLDELVVKWGLGSGLGLFVALGTAKSILYVGYSSLSSIFDQLINYSRYDLSLILSLILTIALGWGIYKILRNGKAFNVSSKASSGKYILLIFFVSFIGAIELSAMDSYLQMLADPYSDNPLPISVVSYSSLLLPDNWHQLLYPGMAMNLGLYLSILIILSFAISYLFIWLYGFTNLYTQPPGFKLNSSEKQLEIEGKIKKIIPLSILVGILLALFSEMLAVVTGFIGMLLLGGYINRCLEEIQGPKKACPNCGSLGIEWLIPGSWCMWECRNCGYRGAIVVDLDK